MDESLKQEELTSVSESDLALDLTKEAEKLYIPAPPAKNGEIPQDLGVSFGTSTTADREAENVVVSLNQSVFYHFCKRAFDIVGSLLALVVLSPVFLITAIAIFIDDPGVVFFSQERSGLNDRPFKMWKFRSMCKNAPELRATMEAQNEMDGPTFKLHDDPRITKVGRFIRRTSIDELPQLFNILRGEMSFVGPRPLATYETVNFTDIQRKRHLVKPGLVCYWQVSGRNKISFDDWMKMDVRYINEASLLTDIKILFLAVPAVISGDGAM